MYDYVEARICICVVERKRLLRESKLANTEEIRGLYCKKSSN